MQGSKSIIRENGLSFTNRASLDFSIRLRMPQKKPSENLVAVRTLSGKSVLRRRRSRLRSHTAL